jgi:hypothetical protein
MYVSQVTVDENTGNHTLAERVSAYLNRVIQPHGGLLKLSKNGILQVFLPRAKQFPGQSNHVGCVWTQAANVLAAVVQADETDCYRLAGKPYGRIIVIFEDNLRFGFIVRHERRNLAAF